MNHTTPARRGITDLAAEDGSQRADQEQEIPTGDTPAASANSGDQQGHGFNARFRKGASGNPAGRRPGSRNKATLILDAMADGEAQAVLDAVLQRAKNGDMQAAAIGTEAAGAAGDLLNAPMLIEYAARGDPRGKHLPERLLVDRI